MRYAIRKSTVSIDFCALDSKMIKLNSAPIVLKREERIDSLESRCGDNLPLDG